MSRAIAQHDGNASDWDCDRNIILSIPIEVGNHSVKRAAHSVVKQLQLLEAAVGLSKQHADIVRMEIWNDEIGNTIAVQITPSQVRRIVRSQVVAMMPGTRFPVDSPRPPLRLDTVHIR